MGIKEDIIAYCSSLGLDTIGFIKCRRFEELKSFYENRKSLGLQNEFEEDNIENRINPNVYMNEGKTIISIAFPYLHNVDYIDNGFSMYTRGLDYHRVLKSYLEKICNYINSLGGNAMAFVDSNTLPERYIAYLAGVGFIGKNNMIITKKYGSYVFLGEIITDLEISCEDVRTFKEIANFKECGNCELCYNECPTKAINKSRKNSNICVSYLTQKKDLEDKFIKLLDGRVFGCDSCQKECPYNLHIEYSKIQDFYPLDFMNKDNNEFLININNKNFKETFLTTSCGWRGKNVLKRNAIIRKKNNGDNIGDIKSDSPYLKDYIDRLF
ncbi:tRNA epoxyqueuosine(34) reductase QueG [Clostridium chauvoei]|uniref:4Fe-4S ferredoxin-type domain-containing protein n=2 Tax=Clostridium chauvoei TaxID=46867 RepID=S6EMX1_9CLOT|nr:tRNA epoxyqueuosine(34) reductase QueG [Clostridium chauvoei]ATD55812.1 tRNA epoxyqueuosine(34) reductase QueG [Clostridium chauvoei]ATD56514.1 tRNA epoxyqueuosine(34) reductase QueG [Clostridium chauvoei]MBX7280170.1 tRNA epoxyqueuosine(34) reductase QueG [Clostridium chauvoei]MBX7282720.1 tRNA epoxyqueuosine(34) reductase QueG [Clostridium chauvoei]MBX7285061.1 tRNA epoxyqueuosine(34) reductase QueG [Clostridium chauvoei]